MLSTDDLETLIALKKCEIEKEKTLLGIGPPPRISHTEGIKEDNQELNPKKKVNLKDIPKGREIVSERGQDGAPPEEPEGEIPPDLERYIRRYMGIPAMLKAGEYSPNNPLVRALERGAGAGPGSGSGAGAGDALLGLGEYERRRHTLRKIRQAQYRQYLDQQAKKKQEAKEQAERERREREEKEALREERERRLLLEREGYSPELRRASVCAPAAPAPATGKVERGVQTGELARALSVAVQTDDADLYRASAGGERLTQAERELSPRAAAGGPAWPRAGGAPGAPGPGRPRAGADLPTGARRRSYGDFDERPGGGARAAAELRRGYMPSIFDADAIHLRNLHAEKEAAARRHFYQQELKNQILEQQRIREERKTREKLLEQAEMRRLEEQLRQLRAAHRGEAAAHRAAAAAMKEDAEAFEAKRSELQAEIHLERQNLLRATHAAAADATSRHATAPDATPRHATPQHATAPDATPRHATPQHATAPDATSRHATAPDATPRHATPQHATAPDATPRHATPQHATAPDATPRHATPQHATAPDATPRHATPQHATAPDATPRHATPQHATAPDATPRHATPQHATAPDATSRHATAPDATPRHATPQHATAPDATPRHATPQHATTPDATPQHATSSRAAPPRSELPFYYNSDKSFRRLRDENIHRPSSFSIPGDSMFSPDYDVDSYLRRNLNFRDRIDVDIENIGNSNDSPVTPSIGENVVAERASVPEPKPTKTEMNPPNREVEEQSESCNERELEENNKNHGARDLGEKRTSGINNPEEMQKNPAIREIEEDQSDGTRERPRREKRYTIQENQQNNHLQRVQKTDAARGVPHYREGREGQEGRVGRETAHKTKEISYEDVDNISIPVLRHSPKNKQISMENTSKLSDAMRRVEEKWQVPAVQKNVLKCASERGNSVSILTQLGSIRRQLQREQLKLDHMLTD